MKNPKNFHKESCLRCGNPAQEAVSWRRYYSCLECNFRWIKPDSQDPMEYYGKDGIEHFFIWQQVPKGTLAVFSEESAR